MSALVPQNETILIVTADNALRDQLTVLLQDHPISLMCCEDAASALELLPRHAFALILIDEALPDELSAAAVDALTDDLANVVQSQPIYRLCEAIRQQPELTETPLIVLLSANDDAIIERAFSHGATDYLIKPLRPAIVQQRINYIMRMNEVQTQLRQQEERYRIISNSISDYAYAFRVEPDGTIYPEWSTKAFELITGYVSSELGENTWSRMIHPDDVELTQQRWQRLVRGERDVSEFRIITKRGKVRWLRDHGQPIFDSNTGRVNRIYGAAQDITDYKRSEAIMQAKTAELEERNQELDSFAHTVAHDLKNPIASMMGFASLILSYYDRMSEDHVREHLAMIMESGYKAKDIVNSLLLLSTINKQDNLTYTPLAMNDILNEVLRRYMTMIREYRAEIIMPQEFPVALGYAPWVEEIWSNYFSNALKYGGKPPRVIFGAEQQLDGMLNFYIIDNGDGLTLEERDQVFLPFTRFSQAKIDGHGLGLSVVHRIVTKLGGEVSVEPVVGGGSKFMFTLPSAAKASSVR